MEQFCFRIRVQDEIHIKDHQLVIVKQGKDIYLLINLTSKDQNIKRGTILQV